MVYFIKISIFCAFSFSLLFFNSCGSKKKLYEAKLYKASYEYFYVDEERESTEDSVTIYGQVITPKGIASKIRGFAVQFIRDIPLSSNDDLDPVYAWTDNDGNFQIKLKTGMYEIYTGSLNHEISFWIRDLGVFGNTVHMKIFTQSLKNREGAITEERLKKIKK